MIDGSIRRSEFTASMPEPKVPEFVPQDECEVVGLTQRYQTTVQRDHWMSPIVGESICLRIRISADKEPYFAVKLNSLTDIAHHALETWRDRISNLQR